MRHRRALSAAVAVATTAVLSVAVPGVAWAGGPNVWTQLSQNSGAPGAPTSGSGMQPSVARVGADLQVVWQQSQVVSGGEQESLMTSILGAKGNVLTPSTGVLTGWSQFADDPIVLTVGGVRTVAFGGIFSSGSTENGEPGRYATSADGVTWTLGEGALTGNANAYANYGMAAVDAGGTIATAINNGGAATLFNTTTAPTAPDVQVTRPGAGCCAYDAALVRDAADGRVYTAYYSNASNALTDEGIQVAQVLPSLGEVVQAPGSVRLTGEFAGSVSADQRVATAARVGGGAYVAYKLGHPTVTGIRVWRIGTSQVVDVAAPEADRISLAAGQGGRLWLAWTSGSQGSSRLFVARSNPAATAFGSVRSVALPKGTNTVYHTATDGTNLALDLVVTARNGGDGPVNVFHTQALAPLTVRAPKAVKRGATLAVVVADAGAPVGGAKVTFLGVTKTTNTKGVASFSVPKRAKTGAATIAASRGGYLAGTAKTTVLK